MVDKVLCLGLPVLLVEDQTCMKSFSRMLFLILFLLPGYMDTWGQTNQLATADSLYLLAQYKSALTAYKRVLKTDSKNAMAWNRYGYSLHQTGNLDDAIQAYKTSLEHAPAPVLKLTLESRLARIYALKNDTEQSLGWLTRAVASGYNNTYEMDNHKDFLTVRPQEGFVALRKKILDESYPCSKNPKNREFDFWLGEWDVYNATGTLVGQSVIQSASGECMILENWTSAMNPYTGKSINFYNSTTGRWEQHWVGSAGDIGINPNGEYKDGAMRFVRETTDAAGKPMLTHFNFHNLGPNKVRQHLENSSDTGKTWKTVFDYTYVRKKM